MGEDKRVKKTKKNLKQTLITLLVDKPFEQITVTELCETSDTSRITFYTHYADKYELVNDLFSDMAATAEENYERLQRENNPQRGIAAGCCNLLDCILNLYYSHIALFSKAAQAENPYLSFLFYQYVLRYVEKHIADAGDALNLKYSAKKTTGFLCYGLWGFINAAHSERESVELVKRQARELLMELLRSNALTEVLL